MPLSVDISVFLWLRKQQPRFAQGQPKGYFQMKELDIKHLIEPLKLFCQWMKGGESRMPACANMCHYLPAWANIAVCQLRRERQPLCNSHDGLNLRWFKMFASMPRCSVPWQKLRAGAEDLLYSTVWIWSMSWHPFFAEGNLCRFAEESFPREACLHGHQSFSVVAQATAKIGPRPAQGLFSNERTS